MNRGGWKGRQGTSHRPRGVRRVECRAEPPPPQWVPQTLVLYSPAHPASAQKQHQRDPLHPSPSCRLPGLSPVGCPWEMGGRKGAGTHRAARCWGSGGGVPCHSSQLSRHLWASAASSLRPPENIHNNKVTGAILPRPKRLHWDSAQRPCPRLVTFSMSRPFCTKLLAE